jgi:hypothetical protein
MTLPIADVSGEKWFDMADTVDCAREDTLPNTDDTTLVTGDSAELILPPMVEKTLPMLDATPESFVPIDEATPETDAAADDAKLDILDESVEMPVVSANARIKPPTDPASPVVALCACSAELNPDLRFLTI